MFSVNTNLSAKQYPPCTKMETSNLYLSSVNDDENTPESAFLLKFLSKCFVEFIVQLINATQRVYLASKQTVLVLNTWRKLGVILFNTFYVIS